MGVRFWTIRAMIEQGYRDVTREETGPSEWYHVTLVGWKKDPTVGWMLAKAEVVSDGRSEKIAKYNAVCQGESDAHYAAGLPNGRVWGPDWMRVSPKSIRALRAVQFTGEETAARERLIAEQVASHDEETKARNRQEGRGAIYDTYLNEDGRPKTF